jgi:hypothetical protein
MRLAIDSLQDPGKTQLIPFPCKERTILPPCLASNSRLAVLNCCSEACLRVLMRPVNRSSHRTHAAVTSDALWDLGVSHKTRPVNCGQEPTQRIRPDFRLLLRRLLGRASMFASSAPAALLETVPWMSAPQAEAVRASIAAHDPATQPALAAANRWIAAGASDV